MNPLNINHIKAEKAKSIIQRHHKLRNITNIFRVFEIFLVLAVISRISFQLPFAFKLSNEYLHSLSLILVSPRFVFIVGNAIVITLFVNSRQFNTQCQVKLPKSPPIYDQKNIKFEQKNIQNLRVTEENQVIKIYQRSKSEKLGRQKMERSCCRLRRSNTEMKSFRGFGCCKDAGEGHYPEDHMSSEEFRRTIEDFIAKQQRFLREEEEEFSAL